MKSSKFNLLLADDDQDDCLLFKDALDDLQVAAKLTAVNDGEQLINFFENIDFSMPDALYLDLNMPRKNGFDCLKEIKQNEKLKIIPVFIFSTSYDPEMVNKLHELGANYYIQKPVDFSKLKKVIARSLELISSSTPLLAAKDKFVITINS